MGTHVEQKSRTIFLPWSGFEPQTSRLAVQHANHWASAQPQALHSPEVLVKNLVALLYMITAIVIDPFKMENVNMLKLRTISAMKDELAKYCYQYLSEHRQQVSENNGFIDSIKIYL